MYLSWRRNTQTKPTKNRFLASLVIESAFVETVSRAAQLHAEAGAARLRLGSRAACFLASVRASRRLRIATRFFERHARQPPRRSGFVTRNRPHSLA